MHLIKFTVIVCIYNSTIKNIEFTLESLVHQDIDELEIIIADDGSKINLSSEIKGYFESKQFKNYVLLFDRPNRGTVINLQDALKYAHGKYVKPLGAGDAFVDNNVLSRTYDYMETTCSNFLFSDMVFFEEKNGKLKLENHCLPRVRDCYVEGSNKENIMENIIVFNDQICGASIFYQKNRLIDLLALLSGTVVYMEDLCQYFQLLDGETISYFASKCVMYECGSGISNSGNTSSNQRMKKDKDAFLQMLFDKYADNSYVERRKNLENIDKMTNSKVLKLIKKTYVEPKWIYFRILRMLN